MRSRGAGRLGVRAELFNGNRRRPYESTGEIIKHKRSLIRASRKLQMLMMLIIAVLRNAAMVSDPPIKS